MKAFLHQSKSNNTDWYQFYFSFGSLNTEENQIWILLTWMGLL